MPYKIHKVSGGEVVEHAGHKFSKHPQSHEMAVKQLRAIEMHTHFKEGHKHGGSGS